MSGLSFRVGDEHEKKAWTDAMTINLSGPAWEPCIMRETLPCGGIIELRREMWGASGLRVHGKIGEILVKYVKWCFSGPICPHCGEYGFSFHPCVGVVR